MSATGQNDTLAVVFDAASVGLQTSGGGSVNRDSARLLARLHAARVPVCVLANTHNSTGSHSHERRHVEVTSSAGELSVLHIPEDAESAVAAVSTHVQTQFRVQPAFVAVVLSSTAQLPPDELIAAGFRVVFLTTGDVPGRCIAAHCVADVPAALARACGAVVAGTAFTAKRESSLLMGGLIHPLPRHGMCYTPLCGVNACDGGDDTASLVARCDVILHKATDQLQVDVCPGHALRFTPDVQVILDCAALARVPILDPPGPGLDAVFDRSAMAALLSRMPPRLGGNTIATKAPPTADLQSLSPSHVAAALHDAGIALPCLLKPRAACGTPTAHGFALLMRVDAASEAAVDLPAVAQSFVHHNGTVHKVYCFGDSVFTAEKRSLPAAPADAAGIASGAVSFDALHALPFSWPGSTHTRPDSTDAAVPPLDMTSVRAMAAWLRTATGLTLFGFDVLVDAASGAHLVVDLNYFPSATGVPGAAEALAQTVRDAAAGKRV